MWRILSLCGLLALAAHAQDPAFDDIPFEEWFQGGDAPLKWTLRVQPPTLTAEQRLETVVWIRVDGHEFAERERIMAYLEIRDQNKRTYQSHCALRLTNGHRFYELRSVDCVQHALITPGEYEIRAAIYDAASKAHSAKQTTLRVGEPLRNFLKNPPSVEFTDAPVRTTLANPPPQNGVDPAFEKVPFDQWLKKGGGERMRWSMLVRPARLGENQRLWTGVEVTVEEAEFAKRSGNGRLVVYLDIRDGNQQPYRTHRALRLTKKASVAVASLRFSQSAYVVPGDYEIAAAVYDTQSKQYSLKRAKLHVPKLAHDPLPEIWRYLPNVAFTGYSRDASLFLPVRTEKPLRIEVVVNEAVNQDRSGGGLGQRGILQPRLAVISGMEIANGSIRVTMLDVERGKVYFTGEVDGRTARRLGAGLGDPKLIDVNELANHKTQARFFVSEVSKLLEKTSGVDRVLIVLSAPLAFPKGQEEAPMELAPAPGTRVFYIRCQSNVQPPPNLTSAPFIPSPDSWRGTPNIPTATDRHLPFASNVDSLERTLKPLNPRVFNVTTAEQFRKALGAIMNELSESN